MAYRGQQSWKLEKAWADGHRPAIEEVVRSVAGTIINIQVSSFQEDTSEAIDYDIQVESGAMACRIRRADRVAYRDLTMTSFRPSGAPPEVDKIRKGRVRWYLYAWARQGGFVEWMFVDLDVVRRKGLIEEALKKDSEVVLRDGSRFVHISFDELDREGALIASKRAPSNERFATPDRSRGAST
ncbi:MAG TPA: hypothetical protein VG929_05935 [Actinomycetota bacterium]|nr:hypothetical protein [Actinomycetota bacterium]